MSKWKIIELNDVCEFIKDGTHQTPKYSETGFIFLSSKNVKNGVIDWNDVKFIPNELHEKLYNVLKPQVNDILLAKNGTTGIAAIVDREEIFDVYVSLAVLRPNQKIINPNYLLCAINSPQTKLQFDLSLKGIGVPNLHLNSISKTTIPLPPLETQRKIADNLDKVSHTIDLCSAILEKLDLLVKSRFVEMFGEYSLNPNNYKFDILEQHIDLLSGYPFKSSQYVDDGINICGGLIIMPQSINWGECKHWESTIGFERYLLKENDIVMALDRPWISEGFKIAKIEKKYLPALLIQRTARIRAKDINQDYLYHCFLNCGFDKHCNVTGSLVPHISAKDINSFSIMLPPLERQNQFADFVEQTEKSKVAVKQVKEKAETLKKKLMQDYFG